MKKFFLITFLILLSTNNIFAASSSSGSNTKSSYDQAVKLVIAAKNYEKKGKSDKATKRYEKALKLLLKSNKKKPNKPDTLNYLGFTSRKLGNFDEAEKYYLSGLKIKPNHNRINQYLGELYLNTDRKDKAIEQLTILESCNCKEYNQLKEIIEGKKVSKY